MKIGVVAAPDLPAEGLREYTREAERLGFDQVWFVEDCFLKGGVAQAAVALADTRTICVGLGVLPAGARNPVFAAMEIATLANLFPGRIMVGVGHGMPHWMRQVGGRVASPVTLLTEHVTALRALLAGDEVTSEGRYVALRGVRLDAPPRIVPPLFAGVRGPVSLAATAPITDGAVLAEPVTPEYVAAVRRLTALDGTPRRIVAYNVAAVDRNPARAKAFARGGLRWIGDPDWAPHLRPLDFFPEFERHRARSASREHFAASLPDPWVDRLAVVGTPATAARRLRELEAAGATDLVLIPAGDDPLLAVRHLAEILGELR